jgi:hypothetical protein
MKKPAKKRRAKNPDRDAELRAQPEDYSGQLFKPATDPEADREELRGIAEQYEAYATLLQAEPFAPPDLMGRVLAVAEAARMGSEEPDEELAGITRHVEDPLTGDEIDVMCDALTASTMLRRLKLAFKSGLR